jgi:hypothetical protein
MVFIPLHKLLKLYGVHTLAPLLKFYGVHTFAPIVKI